jgi:hypothetical protein
MTLLFYLWATFSGYFISTARSNLNVQCLNGGHDFESRAQIRHEMSQDKPHRDRSMIARPTTWLLVVAMASLLSASKHERSRAATLPTASSPEVDVVIPHEQPVTLTTELPGRTAAFRVAEVRPQVGGMVLRRWFTEGAEVKVGQILFQIDPQLYQANLASAEA